MWIAAVIVTLVLQSCRDPDYKVIPTMGPDGRVTFEFRELRGRGVNLWGLVVSECIHGQWVPMWSFDRSCKADYFGYGCDVASIAYGETRGGVTGVTAKPLIRGRRYAFGSEGNGAAHGDVDFIVDERGFIHVLPSSACLPAQGSDATGQRPAPR